MANKGTHGTFLETIEIKVHSLNPEEARKMREAAEKLMHDKDYVRNLVEAKARPDPWQKINEDSTPLPMR